MRVETAIRRRVVFALVVAALLVGRPQEAWAKQDWWGWLEEFSGPGPFNGFEISLEFACVNVTHKRVVEATEIRRAFPQLDAAGKRVDQAFGELASDSGALKVDRASGQLRAWKKAPAAEIGQLLLDLQRDIEVDIQKKDDTEARLIQLRPAVQRAQNEWQNLRVIWTEAYQAALLGGTRDSGIVKAVARPPTFTMPGSLMRTKKSCWGAQSTIEDQRQQDRADNANVIEALWRGQPVDKQSAQDVIVERRDWQTGLVIDVGAYWSIENNLFVPTGTMKAVPRLYVVPIEFLAHHKLSPAIDIGAGVGTAIFHVDFNDFPEQRTKPAAFYLVPLSIVVRPARLFSNQRWAAAFGYRLGLRYFGNLEGKDFGAPEGSVDPSRKYFTQHGEFVWGAAAFVDLVSLLGR